MKLYLEYPAKRLVGSIPKLDVSNSVPLDVLRSFIPYHTLVHIYHQWYSTFMVYEVEVTDEFRTWYEDHLIIAEQEDVARVVEMLEQSGPMLPFPYSSGVVGSKFPHMRELRIQHKGRPYRVLYAFDPRRMALLLLGGDKTGDKLWYERMVPKADALYKRHLRKIAEN